MSAHMPLDCDGFAAELADYLEGDAPDAVRAAVESHAAECADCRQLLEDLRSLRHEAAALPALVPSRDLWSGIAERIDARVIPLDRPSRTALPARRTWARPAIAAAALVVATAGITYYTTRVTMTTSAPGTQVAVVPSTSGPTADSARNGTVASTPSTVQRGTEIEPATPRAGSAGRPAGSPARFVSAVPIMEATEPVYDREIVKLRSIMRTRRSQLDPKTIAVLEQSISVIDSAIAQSRAALARDPASAFLANQLIHSLEKKVELLRTAALLPART